MNLRLFLLIGMTALFAVLWSSDERYQETQMAAARAERQRLSAPASTVEEKGVAAIEPPPSVPKSPLDASSWIAPTFVVSPLEATRRQPVAAPIAVPQVLPLEGTRSPMISVIVSFQRPSFQFVGEPLGEDSTVATGSEAVPGFNAELAARSRLASRVRFEIDGQTCWLRWQMRRTAFVARRRFLMQVARQWEWGALAGKIVLGALGQADSPAKNAAATPAGESR